VGRDSDTCSTRAKAQFGTTAEMVSFAEPPNWRVFDARHIWSRSDRLRVRTQGDGPSAVMTAAAPPNIRPEFAQDGIRELAGLLTP